MLIARYRTPGSWLTVHLQNSLVDGPDDSVFWSGLYDDPEKRIDGWERME